MTIAYNPAIDYVRQDRITERLRKLLVDRDVLNEKITKIALDGDGWSQIAIDEVDMLKAQRRDIEHAIIANVRYLVI